MEAKEARKELAKLKRVAIELAAKIHDIVEETLWEDYTKLPVLSEQITKAIEEAEEFRRKHCL